MIFEPAIEQKNLSFLKKLYFTWIFLLSLCSGFGWLGLMPPNQPPPFMSFDYRRGFLSRFFVVVLPQLNG